MYLRCTDDPRCPPTPPPFVLCAPLCAPDVCSLLHAISPTSKCAHRRRRNSMHTQAGTAVGARWCCVRAQSMLRGVPVTAVTATATKRVADDILTTLGIADRASCFKVGVSVYVCACVCLSMEVYMCPESASSICACTQSVFACFFCCSVTQMCGSMSGCT